MIIGAALLASLLALLGVALVRSSPGVPAPFLGPDGRPLPGSLSEKVRITINGVEQGMILKGRDRTRPVLLYLHGGLPDSFLEDRYPTGLEDLFVVCWWEQRGAGLSYHPELPRESLTVEQLVADTLEVTDHLRHRFGQDRIYLMGHSGGSFLGMLAVARAPERYHAYLGVAQMSHQLRSEVLAHDTMLELARARGDAALARRLEVAPVTLEGGVSPAYLRVRDEAMHSQGGGTMRGMTSVVEGIFLPSLRTRQYTLGEKLNLWRGKASTGVSAMWEQMLGTDLAQAVPRVRVPVYFLHGVHDLTCSYSLAEAYFRVLDAPLKGFYAFTGSAHSPIFEEPGKVQRILREDVLQGTNRLADLR